MRSLKMRPQEYTANSPVGVANGPYPVLMRTPCITFWPSMTHAT